MADRRRKVPTEPAGTPETFPDELQPMMAQLAKAPWRDAAWLFEPKLDGYRMLAFVRRGEARLVSRRGLAYTRAFPSIAAALQSLSDDDVVIDGEIIALDGAGKPSFNALQNRAALASRVDIASAERRTPAVLFCFDLLHRAGRNLRGLPYAERRALLEALLTPGPHLKLVHADEDGVALHAAALATGFEGVVAKRKDSTYQPGRRSPDWLKVKHTVSAEFLIGGFSKGKGARERFGSLVVGFRDQAGRLRYAANVGVGYDEETIDALLARMAPLARPRSPFAEKVPVRAGTTWLEPELVAEVTFAEWTPGGRLRAPVFLRLRDDLDPSSLPRPDPPVFDAATPAAHPSAAAGDAAPADAATRASTTQPGVVRRLLAQIDEPSLSSLEIDGHDVRLTHLERIYWPALPSLGQAAVTKRDLVRYLLRMSGLMLPHLRDRPLTLFRWPGGIQARRILQKHPEGTLPAFVETATVFSETKGVDDEYLLCNNLATLVWLADNGGLEIHVWHSRVRGDPSGAHRPPPSGSIANLAQSAIDFPDYLLFDLDPYLYAGSEGRGAEPAPSERGFDAGRQAAFWLKDILDGMRLACCVKTSGKTGLHVVVPIVPTLRYDVVRRLARLICDQLRGERPDAVTTEWSTGKRTGKVFLDFNMNVRGKSIIAPYGPRGLPGAPVSMPVTWAELARARPFEFRIPTLGTGRRSDPWKPVLTGRQSLEGRLAAVREGRSGDR